MDAAITSKMQKHYPVLLKEIISIISPQYGGTFVDCTFGQGGYTKKNELRTLNHPLILIPLFIALISLISTAIGENFSKSLIGAPQIGQGIFWYIDLSIMSIVFSQLANIKTAKLILFINLLFVTVVVSFFTFFPYWNSTPISFYYFTDYLCFYGVLVFLLITTKTKNKFYLLFSFLLLGTYFSVLDNRAALLFWITTLLAGIIYYSLNFYLLLS